GPNRLFANDSTHSQKDDSQNPHDDEELLIHQQQTVEIRLPFRAYESLSMMDEDSAEDRERCQRCQKSGPGLKPSFVPKHVQFSLTVSKKMSRNATGATSTEIAFKPCARSITASTLLLANTLICCPFAWIL